MRKLLVLAVLLTFVSIAFAQWSSDPAANNVVSNLSGDQAVPKTAASAENVFFGWYSNDTGSYQMRLQMFNTAGEMQWAENGILISDNAQETWLTDWDMTVDNDGNAILTFNDSRSGNWDIYAYKISPTGEFLWGDDGIQLSTGTGMDAVPVVEITEANNAYVGWFGLDDGKCYVQKIQTDGTLAWDNSYIIEFEENDCSSIQLLAVDSDNVLVKFYKVVGSGWSATNHVYARKLNGDGSEEWEEDTIISDAGGISVWNSLLNMTSDGSNGFFITWHEDRDNDMNANAYIQHVAADGSTSFMNNGIEVVMQMDHEHFYPYVAYDEASELIYVFWDKTDMDQNNHGISGQKLNMDGELLWGDLGTEFMTLGGHGILPFALEEVDGDVICIYDISTDAINGNVKALRVNADGEMVWNEGHVFVSSQTDGVSHMEATRLINDQVVSVWSGTGIFAQNLNIDGSIGAAVGNGFVTGTVSLSGEGDVTEAIISAGTVTTNPSADGTYSLALSAGSYDITASLAGYEDLTISDVTVVGAETTADIDFALIEVESFDPPANVQIDNVTGILSWSAPGAGSGEFSEGFEEAVPPAGWDSVVTNSAATWHQEGVISFSDGDIVPQEGEFQAAVGWDYAAQDEWLITPAFEAGANLHFWSYSGAMGSTYLDHYYVKVSTDGGSSWDILWDAVTDSQTPSVWEDVNIDLSAYSGNIQLAWQAVDGDGAGLWFWWMLDDIAVTATDGRVISFDGELHTRSNEVANVTNTHAQYSRNGDISLAADTRDVTGYNVYLDGSLLEMTSLTSYTYTNLMNGTSYTAAVSAVYNDETESELVEVSFVYDGVSSPEDNVNATTRLLGNYPNPFNPSTTISFSLQGETQVSLEVYNVRGQKVSTLANRVMASGSHQLSWNGTDNAGQPVSSGIYFYRLTTDSYSSSHKMMLIK